MTKKNISQSGYRILVILNLLINNDISRNTIADILKSNQLIDKKLSDDTITFYINTLRENGFNISRPHKHNDFSYTIKNSIPFLLFKSTDIKHLENIKKLASENDDWLFILNFNDFMHSIFKFVNPKNKDVFERKLLNSKPFGYKENAKIFELYEISKNSDALEISYNSPNSGIKIFKVKASNLSLKNNKLYLWCENLIDFNIHYLRIDRIVKFNKINTKSIIEKKPQKVIYKLKGAEAVLYNPGYEKILSKNENEIILETEIQNEFWLIQKIMSYGKDCTILEPKSFKIKIAEKIQKIKELYNE